MLSIGQIMTKDVVTTRVTTPIYDAMKILVEQGISGLPVVDDEQQLLGIITEKDMLEMLLENVITKHQVVGDYMSKDVVFFSPQDSVIKVCEFLMNNPFRRVPVVSDGKLIGIVSRRDILQLILKTHGLQR